MRKYFLFLFTVAVTNVHAQPKMSLQECENTFLKQNLFLLAEHYNIEAAKAQVIQAGIWENPYFTADINAADPENKKAFNFGKQGQKSLAVQQLIYLGGKKKNEVQLARTNVQMAELAFTDLLRNLRFQLRTSFFSLYYDRVAVDALDTQVSQLDSLIRMYSIQVQKGNIPLKDLVRLQSLYLSIKNDRTALVNNTIEEQNKLLLLLGGSHPVLPDPTTEELNKYQSSLHQSLEELQKMAATQRTDLLLADKNREAAAWNLKWQKSLQVPDLTLGASYDQRGGAFNNQVNLTVGLPLRLWNPNKGNIKMAEARLGQAVIQKDAQALQLQSEVTTAFQKYTEAKAHYGLTDAVMKESFDEIYRGVYLNFQRRNISMIEFTDFMESYHQSQIQFSQVKKALVAACEELNYSTGSTLF